MLLASKMFALVKGNVLKVAPSFVKFSKPFDRQ